MTEEMDESRARLLLSLFELYLLVHGVGAARSKHNIYFFEWLMKHLMRAYMLLLVVQTDLSEQSEII